MIAVPYFRINAYSSDELMKNSILKMEKEIEEVKNEFNSNAIKIFFSIYENFETVVKQLNRRSDENVFQQIQCKYVFTLKKDHCNPEIETGLQRTYTSPNFF